MTKLGILIWREKGREAQKPAGSNNVNLSLKPFFNSSVPDIKRPRREKDVEGEKKWVV